MNSYEVILLLDKSDRLVYSRSNPACKKCLETCTLETELVNKCQHPGSHRRGMFASKLGKVYFCTSDKDNLSSNKLFKKQLRFYSEMLGSFVDVRDNIRDSGVKFARRLIHNLTSLHAHILQDLYLIVPQESLSGSTSAPSQLKAVKEALQENENDLPKGFLRIIKNAVAIKTEFNVFLSLYSEKPPLNEKHHNLHRVLRNVSSMYFQDFQEKGVFLVQDAFQGEVLLDYESVGVALHHLFLNAVKYTMNDTTLRIKFPCQDGVPRIELEMVSLPIERNEIDSLYEEGYSGKAARKLSLSGDGSGMGIAKKLLELNGAKIAISAGHPEFSRLGTEYAKNIFTIEFAKKQIRNSSKIYS